MSAPLNILFLCSWYPSRETGNLGNFIQRHAQAVSTIHNVTVVYFIESAENNTEVRSHKNLTEHIIYFKKSVPLLSYYSVASTYIKQICRKEKFDLLHLQVAYPAVTLVHLFKIPYLVTEHFSGYQPYSNFKWSFSKRRVTKIALNKASVICPVSNHLGRAIKKFGVKNNFVKISNVVDTSVFYPAKEKPTEFSFLHISSLEERSKNISGILSAFKELQTAGKHPKLRIGGDGDLNQLKDKIIAAGLDLKNIEIIGPLDYSQVAEEMRRSSALLMFSHFENQPCTILEALCCGIPVVSSDVGGISEEVDQNNGILVERENIPALVKALQQMMENHPQYNPDEIAENASLKYSIETIARLHDKVYVNVLNEAASGL